MCLSKVEVERALVEAEMESEVAALQQEKDALEALHNKMADLETKSQQEKEKVFKRLRFIVNQWEWEGNFSGIHNSWHRDQEAVRREDTWNAESNDPQTEASSANCLNFFAEGLVNDISIEQRGETYHN